MSLGGKSYGFAGRKTRCFLAALGGDFFFYARVTYKVLSPRWSYYAARLFLFSDASLMMLSGWETFDGSLDRRL